jgi:PucR family transcriptional regulator, purine catabolism regulatory protein
MLPTLAEVLDLEAVRRGRPEVLAADHRLGTWVRWVHAIELADVTRLLHGGELVLSTGIALPEDPGLLANYVADLSSAGVSGLAVELGRRYSRLPDALIEAAGRHGVPLIVFHREVPFVEITEAVHARIIDAQLAELRASERVHETFTELSVAGAPPDEIVRQAALLAGRPVILEDLSHRVLACAPGPADARPLLAGFERRARAVAGTRRTFYDEDTGWLVTTVGARGEDWGRVILAGDSLPSGPDTVLIERAASALALGRLLARQQESLERQAHRTLISAMVDSAYADPGEAAARTRALGVPVTGRQLIPVIVRVGDSGPGISAHARIAEVTEALADACQGERVPALVGSLDDVRAGALLSLAPQADAGQLLTALSARVGRHLNQRLGTAQADPFVLGTGTPTDALRDVRRSFLEARQVGDVAIRQPDGRPYYRLPDLRLRGLLHLLRDDARVQTFAERELGPLLAYDDAHGTDLTGCLAAYLEAGGNKAEAAQRAHLARPTFYQRLERIERILGVDLGAAESRTSLHVALLATARPALRQPGREPSGRDRAPAPRRDPEQRLALPDHGLPVLVPVRVLAGDGPVVADQRLGRLRHVDHLGVAVHLDPRPAEVVRQEHHADLRVPTRVPGLGPLRVGGHDDPALGVHPAGHRGRLRAPVGPGGDDDGVVAGPDEVEEFIPAHGGVGRDLWAHRHHYATPPA